MAPTGARGVTDREGVDMESLEKLRAALTDLRSKVEAEAQWLDARHDGSLVTSDYPLVARRLRAVLSVCERVE